MTRETAFYQDPEEFHPERYLGAEPSLQPSSFTFGFGRRCVNPLQVESHAHTLPERVSSLRRICPGQAFADQSLWLAIANIVATFDILKPFDEAGREVTPPAKFRPGFTRCARCPPTRIARL